MYRRLHVICASVAGACWRLEVIRHWNFSCVFLASSTYVNFQRYPLLVLKNLCRHHSCGSCRRQICFIKKKLSGFRFARDRKAIKFDFGFQVKDKERIETLELDSRSRKDREKDRVPISVWHQKKRFSPVNIGSAVSSFSVCRRN